MIPIDLLIDKYLDRRLSRCRIGAFLHADGRGNRTPVAVTILREVSNIGVERENEAEDDQARPDVVQHRPARLW